MKRHHVVAVGFLAAVALFVFLYPRSAETPTQEDRPAAGDPTIDPDAPQGRDRPLQESVDAREAVAAKLETGAKLDASVPPAVATVVKTQTPDGGVEPAPMQAQSPDSELTPKQKQMNQDPRMQEWKNSLRAAMNEIKPQIKDCYERALKQDPSIAGSIKLTLEIKGFDGGGRVVNGEVPESEIKSPFFEACVLEKVGTAEFPEPLEGGTIKVTYPFTFDPGGGFGGDPSRR